MSAWCVLNSKSYFQNFKSYLIHDIGIVTHTVQIRKLPNNTTAACRWVFEVQITGKQQVFLVYGEGFSSIRDLKHNIYNSYQLLLFYLKSSAK